MKKIIMCLYSFLLCCELNTNDILKQTLLLHLNFEELILLQMYCIYLPIYRVSHNNGTRRENTFSNVDRIFCFMDTFTTDFF